MKLTKILFEQSDSELVFKTGNKSYDGNLDWSTSKMPNGVNAEKELKELGAEAIAFTNNPDELPSYFLKVYNKSNILNYVLTFYSDGNVFSQQPPDYKFKYENGISLYTTKDEKIGSLIKKGSKAVLALTSEFAAKQKTPAEAAAELKQKEKGEDTWSISDIGHTVLDWAGFIPGIGDALDLVNALWYFIEGKTIDGLLSLIAVIPVVGSAIKGSVKAGMKTVPEIAVALKRAVVNVDEAKRFWKLVKDNNILTAKQLDSVAEGMGNTVKWMTKNRSGIIGKLRSISGNTMDVKTIASSLVKLEDFLQTSAKNIGDITKKAQPSVLSVAAKGSDLIPKQTIRNIGRKIKNLGFFKPAQLSKMSEVLSRRFAAQIAADPLKLNALLRTMPNKKKIDALISNIQKRAKSNIKDPVLLKKFSNIKSLEEYKELFPEIYDDIAKTATDFAQKNNSYFWIKFEDDSLNRIGSLLSTGWFGKESKVFWDELKEKFLSVRKWADILGDEYEDVKEYFHPESINGQPDALIGPLIKSAFKEQFPTAAASAEDLTKSYVKPIVKGATDSAIETDPYIAPKPLVKKS